MSPDRESRESEIAKSFDTKVLLKALLEKLGLPKPLRTDIQQYLNQLLEEKTKVTKPLTPEEIKANEQLEQQAKVILGYFKRERNCQWANINTKGNPLFAEVRPHTSFIPIEAPEVKLAIIESIKLGKKYDFIK